MSAAPLLLKAASLHEDFKAEWRPTARVDLKPEQEREKLGRGDRRHVWAEEICESVSPTAVFGCRSSGGESQTNAPGQGYSGR